MGLAISIVGYVSLLDSSSRINASHRTKLFEEVAPSSILTRPLYAPLPPPFETDFEVIVEELDLHYRSNPLKIDRPYKLDEKIINEIGVLDQKYYQGYELLKERKYQQAKNLFEEVLDKNPNHLNANKGMADLYY